MIAILPYFQYNSFRYSTNVTVCKSNKAEIAGDNVKLSGRFEDKEFLTTNLTVLRMSDENFSKLIDGKNRKCIEKIYYMSRRLA